MNKHVKWRERMILILAVFMVSIMFGSTSFGAVADPDHTQFLLDPLLQPKYANPLPNPLVPGFILTPDKFTYPGVDYYEVSAKQITQFTGILSETTGQPLSTTLWGYGDSRLGATTGLHTYPGPTFEVRSNTPTKVLWGNELPATSLLPVDTTLGCGPVMGPCPPVRITTHVHGAHVQGDSDGGPFTWFTPNFAETGYGWDPNTVYGQTGIYSYPNTQEAGTIWYHDHAMGVTHTNVWAGLAGFYLIRDANEDALQAANTLPKYPYEVPIALQDRNFLTTGELAIPDQPVRDLLSASCQLDINGVVIPSTCPVVLDPVTGLQIPSITPELFGNMNLANGIIWPFLDVEPRPYRLRLLNGCDSRTYILTLSNGGTFYQIGTDQGFLDAPVPLTQIILMPGERVDVLVDFTGVANGTTVELLNIGADGPFMGLPIAMPADPATTGKVMAFKVVLPLDTNVPVSADPTTITSLRSTPVPTLTPTGGVPPRQISLTEAADMYGRLMLTIDGKGIMDAPTELPNLNDTEIWEIANNTPDVHPIHLHLVQFKVLDRQPFDPASFVAATPTTPPSWTLTGVATPPPLQEQGWKDTIQMYPTEVTRVIAKFDIAGSYVWHCHILSHEEHDMMRPYTVVTPATNVTITPTVASPQFVLTSVPVRFWAEGSTNLQALRSADAFEYQFSVRPLGGALTVVQPYSTIRYLDWTPPAQANTYYVRVEARAIGSVAAFEAVQTYTYVISGKVAQPAFSLAGGTYTGTQSISITTSTAGADIYYTVDGSIPSAVNGALYAAPVDLSADTTLKAIGIKAGFTDSNVATATYTFTATAADTPTFSPVAGTYNNSPQVTISSTTPGAIIRYTTDGSAPTVTSTLYATPFTVSASKTINAIAYVPGSFAPSTVGTATYTLVAAQPVFNIGTGFYPKPTAVKMTTATAGAKIYYTIDGSMPSAINGTMYTGMVSIPSSLTLRAIAVKNGYTDSAETNSSYVIMTNAAKPTFSPATGTYTNDQTVTISSTAGATIRYTTDGSLPNTTTGTIYAGPVTVSASQTLKAIAYKDGEMNASAVGYAVYTLKVGQPAFGLPGKTYTGAKNVTITSATTGADIYYTVDGSVPSAVNGTLYTGAVNVASSLTLKAIGIKAGYTNSNVTSASYVIMYNAALPTFSPAGGVYANDVSVTISSTPGATIRYTTDGSVPTTTTGNIYSDPINVGSAKYVKAIAYKAGELNPSAVGYAYYSFKAGTPAYNLPGGSYAEQQSLTMSTATTGAQIRYTLNGTVPTASTGFLYTAPLTIDTSVTVTSRAFKAGYAVSDVKAESFVIGGID